MPNGQVFTRDLDALDRTARLRSSGPGYTPLDLTYSYNPNSQIDGILDGSTPGLSAGGKTHAVSNLTYDGLGQLLSADGWWGPGSFTYDGLGNLLSRSLGTGATQRTVDLTYTVDNRLDQSTERLNGALFHTGDRAVSHDSRGNLITLGSAGGTGTLSHLTMDYDLTDQMVAVSGTNPQGTPVSGSFEYNGEGKRVQMTLNGRNSFYVYDKDGRLVLSHKEHDRESVERLYLESGQAQCGN